MVILERKFHKLKRALMFCKCHQINAGEMETHNSLCAY